ncbi:MAG: hypothetical protein II008_08270 [Oscillospiraceae bacterium]|nr:hypothetical protein [Oscillospiraceae bacterium]
MKRYFVLFIVSLFFAATAAADTTDIDLSGLSFDELVALREQINLAIWNSEEWQEVTVPAGVWEIGKDIPVGHWSVKPVDGSIAYIIYCEELDEMGFSYKSRTPHYSKTIISASHNQHDDSFNEMDFEMENGWYFINESAVVFTPFVHKVDLNFH